MKNSTKNESSIGGLIHIKYIDKLKNNKPNRICFLIDGGGSVKTSFNIVIKEFLPRLKNRELVGCHIYNSTENNEYNWQYQKNYILDQYLFSFDRTIKYPNLLYLQDKKYYHNIIQAYHIANNLSSRFFIFNFYSLKEQNLLIKNIFFGLNFLLTDNNLPTLIMKDELMRDDKEKGVNNNKGYTWLILLDGTNKKSLNVLEYFWPLIDKKKDFIYALSIVNNSFYSDNVKNDFIRKMKYYNLKENINYFYRFEIFETKQYFKYLKEFINFNEDYYFDFILFYNNPLKYKIKKNFSYDIIMELKANIGFVNLEDFEDYNSEEIIDYEEIQRIEKEEMRKKRLLERARMAEERETIRQFQGLQIALLNEYEEKKLEREDTNISLLNESKNDNDQSKISNAQNNISKNINNNDFILSNNLMELPALKNKKFNKRYIEEVKDATPIKDKKDYYSIRNNKLSTIGTTKIKSKSSSKIVIQAKNTDGLLNERNSNDPLNRTNKSTNQFRRSRNNLNNINKPSIDIKPMNLKDKLNIYARNRKTIIKLKQ
jgi:hypothetical protein